MWKHVISSLPENQVHCTSNTNDTHKRNTVSFDFTANNTYGPFTSLVDLYKLQFHLQEILIYRASYGWKKSGATCGSAQNSAVHYHLLPSIEEGKAQEWMRGIHPASTCWSDHLFITKLELRSFEFEAPPSVLIRLLALWSSQSACKMIAQHTRNIRTLSISQFAKLWVSDLILFANVAKGKLGTMGITVYLMERKKTNPSPHLVPCRCSFKLHDCRSRVGTSCKTSMPCKSKSCQSRWNWQRNCVRRRCTCITALETHGEGADISWSISRPQEEVFNLMADDNDITIVGENVSMCHGVGYSWVRCVFLRVEAFLINFRVEKIKRCSIWWQTKMTMNSVRR